jgi:hypothetical protein
MNKNALCVMLAIVVITLSYDFRQYRTEYNKSYTNIVEFTPKEALFNNKMINIESINS